MNAAIVSIHDVQPSTLTGVLQVADLLDELGVSPVTLLIVPGVEWDQASLEAVRRLIGRGGYGVAGHGWSHLAPRPASLYHRLHALIISRDQAEHLSRSTDDVAALVTRCHEWFRTVGLPQPQLYVPPAWALGRMPRATLTRLPFRWYEVLRGCVSAADGFLRTMPLAGFEADTRIRELTLRILNPLNARIAAGAGRPLRLAIHPWDLRYRLAKEVDGLLRREWRFTTVEAFMSETTPVTGGPRWARSG